MKPMKPTKVAFLPYLQFLSQPSGGALRVSGSFYCVWKTVNASAGCANITGPPGKAPQMTTAAPFEDVSTVMLPTNEEING